MKYLLTALIGGLGGFVMTTCGLFVDSWQFWVLLGCMIAMYIVGNMTKERTK